MSRIIGVASEEFPSLIVEDEDGFIAVVLAEPLPVDVPDKVRFAAIDAGASVIVLADGRHIPLDGFEDHSDPVAGGYTITRAIASPGWTSYRDYLTLRQADRGADPFAGVKFVHLHTHTEYSSLDGLTSVTELCRAVVSDPEGGGAVAAADHGNCAVHPALQDECDKFGLKPIFGMEAYFVPDRHRRSTSWIELDGAKVDPEHLTENEKKRTERKSDSVEARREYTHITLWAETQEGLRNLWAMSTEAYMDGLYDGKPRLDWETLEKFADGVICGTGCLRGPIARPLIEDDPDLALSNLMRLMGIFGREHLFMEIHTNSLDDQIKVNHLLVELAQAYSLPMIAAVDAHYAKKADRDPHTTWMAMQTGKVLGEETSLFQGQQDYHLKTAAEVRTSLSYLHPDVVASAMAATVDIARRCTARVGGESKPPTFSKASTQHPDPILRDNERLREICLANWERKVLRRLPLLADDEATYTARFEREMALLVDKSFAGYFLIVSDYVIWAKERGCLVGPGRGSGGGSLVAYLSDITEVDPVEAKLIFERFLTEGRKSLPDFDIDFPSTWRGPIIGYIKERWGADYVSNIGTVGRLRIKQAVNDMIRVLSPVLPYEVRFTDFDPLRQAVEEADRAAAGTGVDWDEFKAQYADILDPLIGRYPEIFAMVDVVIGRVRQFGKHAAGVVISTDEPLTNLPMRLVEDKKTKEFLLVSQFDMVELEAMGYVKFDFLTIRTLDTLQVAMDLVKEKYGVTVNPYEWSTEYADPQVWDEISRGQTLGLFQIETSDGTRTTKRLQPRNIYDLAAVITIVRPGPKRSGLTEMYLRRRAGLEPVTYPDPRLKEFLGDTFGCLRGDQQVQMSDGSTKAIETVVVGDEVSIDGVRSTRVVASQQTGVRQVGTLTLSDGRQVILTPEHRVLTLDGWVEAKDLGPQHLIPRRVNYRSDAPASAESIRRARLMGWLIGDGSISTASGVAFTKNDESVLSAFESEVAANGDRSVRYVRESATQVQVCGPGPRGLTPEARASNTLKMLRGAGLQGCTSDTKFVPDEIMTGTRAEVLAFLAAYWDTDGSVLHTHATAKTISRRLADQISELLHSVGIATTIYEYDYPGVFINVYDADQFEAVRSLMTKVRPRFAFRGGRGWASGKDLSNRVKAAGLSKREAERLSGVARSCLNNKAIKRSTFEAMALGCGIGGLPDEEVYSTPKSYVLIDGEVPVYDIEVEDESRFVSGSIPVHNSMIYQEQVMATVMQLAGYDSTEADGVRKLLGKKQVEKVVAAGEEFVSRAVAFGTDRAVAETLWSQMAEFAKYGFNKAHAYAYAVIGYWCAFMKFNYPAEFLVAALSTVDDDRVAEFVEDCRRAGYEIVLPNVNRSALSFRCEGLDMIYGLQQVKGIGTAPARDIVARAPFTSYEDFIARCVTAPGTPTDRGHVKALAAVGALDDLYPNRRALEQRLAAESDGTLKVCQSKTAAPNPNHPSRLPCSFDWANEIDPPMLPKGRGKAKTFVAKPPPKKCTVACRQFRGPAEIDPATVPDYTPREVMDRERELLGVWITHTPFDSVPEDVWEDDTIYLGQQIEAAPANAAYISIGVITGMRKNRDKNGNQYAFVTLNLKDAEIEAICFASVYEDRSAIIKDGALGVVEINKSPRGYQLADFVAI